MSFLEGLGAAGEAEGADLGKAQLAGLISRGIDEGLSGARMLDTLREAGVGIRSQDFYALTREVRTAREMAGTWTGQALDATPDASMFMEHTGSAYQGYEYRVPLFYRESSMAQHEVGHTVFTIRTDELITPEEALSNAQQIWEEGRDTGTGEGQEFLGFGTVGLHHFAR